eukprot:5312232-Pleurochrysis_carterae.AAC.3
MKTPLLSEASEKLFTRSAASSLATVQLAHARMSRSPMPRSARKRQACLCISCQTTASTSVVLPSAMSLPPMPMTCNPMRFAASTAALQLPTRS